MARVEWSALSGDEVETLLSNLMYNRHERAQRIRPSQGDFGIDILRPSDEEPPRWDVYQVKKFATNLDPGQKSQIEKSFRRVLLALVRRKVPLRDWYLVTPLDPTLHNLLDWFAGLPARAISDLQADAKINLTALEVDEINAWLADPDRVIAWKGLNFCEDLAADYPYVVDYYLHGGRERLREAVADVAALLRTDLTLRARENGATEGGETAALVAPGDVLEHIHRLDKVLDTDPHYRYGISLDLNPPDLHAEPRLVAATQQSLPGGRWLTFKIYQRSAQSLDERPIPLDLKLRFESTEEREAFEAWVKYGRPTKLTASFTMDLPGGLHSGPAVGRVRLSPTEEQSVPYRNRLRIVDPDGTPLAELAFNTTSAQGQDGTGVWTHGADHTETLVSDALFDLSGETSSISFSLEALAGREAAKVEAAVAFASHLAAPNTLQVAGEYGPFVDFTPITAPQPLADAAIARFIGALATIQRATSTSIRIPDVADMSTDDRAAVRRAAALIDGQVLIGTWKHFGIEKDPAMTLEVGYRYDFRIALPLEVTLANETLVLGTAWHEITGAVVVEIVDDQVRVVPGDSDVTRTTYSSEAPSRNDGRGAVQFRPSTASEANGNTEATG